MISYPNFDGYLYAHDDIELTLDVALFTHNLVRWSQRARQFLVNGKYAKP
jgi:hypothetical protein